MSQRIISIVGARPNFPKLASVARALARHGGVEHVIVHTGQHYDPEMSGDFFRDLALPEPDYNLEIGSGSHAFQVATTMLRFEPLCVDLHPDVVLVYGDVNSTVAAALVAAKLGIKVGHVEAGFRSFDWSMPEEINRVVTDRLSDLLFAPYRDTVEHLRSEGIPAPRVHLVGDIMIDSLVSCLPAARARGAARRLGVDANDHVVVTLHRAGNVDDRETLRQLLDALVDLGREETILFPVHPRTRARMQAMDWSPPATSGLRLLDPLAYLDLLSLLTSAKLVVTDSGGLQAETSYLGVPCLTVRPNTERPVTCTSGTNQLVESRRDALTAAARAALRLGRREGVRLEGWDGRAAERIAAVLVEGASFP